jgi:malonyl-CoA/methylmalonyl-CoA synthetase
MTGSHVLLLDRFVPETIVDLLTNKQRESRCTVFMAVPAMYNKLIEHLDDKTPDFSHMRLLASGSAPLSIQDFGRIKEVFGQEPLEREGMTETGMNFSNPLKGTKKPGSIGLPLPDLEVRIVDPETLQDLEPGQTGEFLLKGKSITPGYWKKPEETDRVFHDGWFRTGDLGKVDDEGYYYLTDRIKHIIISGGENISPKEIQNVINRIEGVIESAVVGVADEKWGEKVVAALVTDPGMTIEPKDISAICKEHLHDWKCPKEILLVDQLPKNTMGKVLQDEVKQLFIDSAQSAPGSD